MFSIATRLEPESRPGGILDKLGEQSEQFALTTSSACK